MQLSKRVKTLTPSSTLAISALATELKNKGHDVIGLGVGEPDFNTPDYIIQAGKEAMDQGLTKYTPSGGVLELKNVIIDKFAKDNDLTYKLEEIIVTTGAKHALYTLFQVLLDEGDEVVIPAPYWVSYTEQVKLAGGKPIIVNTNESTDFKMTAEQLEKAITERTKAIILNSPSNPTGMMYTKEELATLGEVCEKHNLFIVSDEIYEKLIYTNEKHYSMAQISPKLKDLTIVINGVSKSHAMTGWRIGYAAGHKKIIQAMTNHVSHATSNPTTIAQYAAISAYKHDTGFSKEMQSIFSERLNLLYEKLIEMPGVDCIKPSGAFYLFPNIKEAVHRSGFHSVNDWVTALLEEEKVAIVPGEGFGSPNNVRLSYAISIEQLEEAAERIHRFITNNIK